MRVVCIKDDWIPNEYSSEIEFPVKGRIYTVRCTYFDPIGKHTAYRFYEIRNRKFDFLDGYHEPAFNEVAFRPVKETDISVFTKLLQKTPNKKELEKTE